MKNKKIWTRIGAIFACLLLVGVLVVPCFAYYNPQQSDDAFIAAVTDSFLSAYSADIGYAGSAFLYRSSTPAEQRAFFSNAFFLSGGALKGNGSEIYFPSPPASLSVDGEDADYALFETMSVSLVYGRYDDMQTKVYSDVVCRYVCSYSTTYGYTLELRLDYESGQDAIVYQSADITRPLGSIALKSVVIDGSSVDFSNSFYVAFLLPDTTSSDMLGALQCMFFGASEKTLLYPNSYLEILANSEYVTDNYEQGYDDGYGNGYRVGYIEGEASTDAYQEGYQAAVSDIESGDFGRNFLSGVFTVPLRAMENFEIIQWETQSGDIYSVSILTVFSAMIGLSLFIWFLRMFAGG